MWLRGYVLLLVLGALASAQEKSCVYKKTQLTIVSGEFTGMTEKPLEVKVKVEHANRGKSLCETKTLRSFTPLWNQVLDINTGSRGYMLFVKINNERPMYICYVKANIGQDDCTKTRGDKTYSVKFSISC